LYTVTGTRRRLAGVGAFCYALTAIIRPFEGGMIMGEVDTSPGVAAKPVEDLTSMAVDPEKGERLYKAALIRSDKGSTYRMLAKSLGTGKLEIVHYACDLDATGNPTSKWRITRIMSVAPERFETEIEFIKKTLKGNGEEAKAVSIHDMTAMTDIPAQGTSLDDWSKKMAAEFKTA
jgi:hypothetical protein